MSISALDFDHHPCDAHCVPPTLQLQLHWTCRPPLYSIQARGAGLPPLPPLWHRNLRHRHFPQRHHAHSSAIWRPADKAVHTAKFEQQFREYRACSINGPHSHTIIFWARCYAPKRQCTGNQLLFIFRSLTHLPPERLIRLKLKAKRAPLCAVPCHGCTKNHCEFYSLANMGDLEGFRQLVEDVFIDLGIPFVW
jgi:hypothetical protein